MVNRKNINPQEIGKAYDQITYFLIVNIIKNDIIVVDGGWFRVEP